MADGTVVTFYSWKGGVGRSMALANVGVLLAQRGRSVLMVDWDLEAPGLDRYFSSEEAGEAGVAIEAPNDETGLLGALEEAATSQDFPPPDAWRRRLRSIRVPKLTTVEHGAASPTPNLLHLLPSGEAAPRYNARLEGFSWADLYKNKNGAAYLESLRTQWAATYDFVLIDSRTGLSDSGGVCTIQMPDWLVLVFTSNEQSLDGGLRVIEGVQRARRDFAFDRMPLTVLPLLSRWDGENEVDLAARWLARTAEATKTLFDSWLPATLDPLRYYQRIRIPHLARFSFGEPLPVVTHSLTDEALPGIAYARITRLFDTRFADAGSIVDPSYHAPRAEAAPGDGENEKREIFAAVLSGEPELARQIRLQEQRLGGNTIPFASYLAKIGKALRMLAQFSQAEMVFRRALAINQSVVGPDHPNVASDLNNLARLLHETNRLSEAEPLFRRALAIDEASYGPNHPEVATNLNNLAALLHETNRLSEAEPLFRRALAIDEASYGPDHPEVATDLNNLARLLHETNRLSEAEPLFRRALAIDEASYGSDHPEVATDLNNLAGVLSDTKRLSEAESLYRRALAIYEVSYGPDHPKVATALNNLAGVLSDTNRLSEAEELYRRALAIAEASYGPDNPKVATALNNLAGVLSDTNRLSEAEELYRRALAIAEASYGPDHPDVATDLNNLAGVLGATNRLSEAEQLYRRALAIAEVSYGPDHPDVANRLNNLAGVLRATNRLSDAEPLYRRALLVLLKSESSAGHQHPRLDLVIGNYTGLLKALGHSEAEIEASIQEVARDPSETGAGEP